jgi:ATP-dependent protease ClpP protease subunit
MQNNINITGSINSSHIGLIDGAIKRLDAEPSLILDIHIDSDGGDPDPAKVIFDKLKNYRSRIRTVSGKKCMSSAVLIFLAADERLANHHSEFMIHPTSWTLWGMYSFMKSYSVNMADLTLTLSEVYTMQGQLEKAAKRLKEIEDYTDEIFRERAKLPESRFIERRTINCDQNITAAESLKYGISTKLI